MKEELFIGVQQDPGESSDTIQIRAPRRFPRQEVTPRGSRYPVMLKRYIRGWSYSDPQIVAKNSHGTGFAPRANKVWEMSFRERQFGPLKINGEKSVAMIKILVRLKWSECEVMMFGIRIDTRTKK